MEMQRNISGQRLGTGVQEEEVWLLGQPSLRKYLDHVEEMVVDGKIRARAALAAEWREANDYFYELETAEAGLADQAQALDLDAALRPLAAEVESDSRYRRTFDVLPTRFAMVELDRLIVSQPHVNLDHARRLQSQLGASPSEADLFRFCLPLERKETPVNVRKTGSKRYLFWSASSDLRFLEPALLTAAQVEKYESFGPLGGIVGLMVGFGSNFLNVIQSGTRLLLHNGHHRAFALRAMGVTHAPCIVQTVTRRDELGLVASHEVAAEPEFYFSAARPPLLKDFFDPKVRKILQIHKILRAIELSFEVREYEVRDFAHEG